MAEVSERLGSGPSHTCPGSTGSDPCSPSLSASSLPTVPGRSMSPVSARRPPLHLVHGAHARAGGGGARGAGGRVRGRDPGPRGGRAPRTGWVCGAGVPDGGAGTVSQRTGDEQGAESTALCEPKVSRVEFVWLWERERGPPRGCGAAALSPELTCTSGCGR